MSREDRNKIIELGKEKDRRYKLKRKRQIRNKCILSIMAVLLVALLTITIQSFSSHASENDREIRYKYYTNIEVAYGDSLWKIADRYLSYEYENHNAYIKEVVRLNHLQSTSIDAGTFLIVPYYSSELKY